MAQRNDAERFVDAAVKTLERIGKPLSINDLTASAIQYGYLKSTGKTPALTMKARISTDILRNGQNSRFMRTDAGRFALRCWGLPEYTARRFRKSPFDEDVVVFLQNELGALISGSGFHLGYAISSSFIPKLFAMRRRLAEENQDVIQLVSVFIVRYKDRIVTYKRSKRLPESRLHDEYSLIFGGHLTPYDFGGFSLLFDPLDPEGGMPLVKRELEEEIILEGEPCIRYLGMLYDDSRQLSKQHLGLVYDVEMNTPNFWIGEKGFLIDARLEPVNLLVRERNKFENWSTILLDEVISKLVLEWSEE